MMNLNVFIGLVVLALLWGPSFLFMKIAVQDIPPLTLAAARVTMAATVLYLVLRSQRQNLPKFGPIWKHFAVTGLFFNALPYALLCWGEQYVDSALASILMGTEPLFVILLAHIFTTDDRLTVPKVTGVLLGFAGLTLLFVPALFEGMQATTLGLIAAALAAVSYAIGVVYAKQKLSNLPTLVGPTAQLTVAAFYLLPLSFIFEQPYTLSRPAWPALGSLLALSIVGTALTFVIYYRLMDQATATSLSMVTYLVPIVGTILGVAILKEQPGWNAYLGCALILGGVMVVNGVFQSLHWRRLRGAAVGP